MELLLDSGIRDWVLIPIIIVMILAGIFRNLLTRALQNPEPPSKDDVIVTQAILRSSKLRQNYKFLPEKSFNLNRSFFCMPEQGFFYKEYANNDIPMMMDPTKMLSGLKQNMTYGVSTMLLLSWVSHFCSGFILARVPFPLTQRFRGLLQRGVELSALDVTYVSSSSWYFLALVGMNGIVNLILGDLMDQTNILTQVMPMPMGPMGKDLNKLTTSEKDNLLLINHKDALQTIEDEFLNSSQQKYGPTD